MKGSETQLITYLHGSGANTNFIVPVYQRYYSWKTENCKRLYSDLIKLIHDKDYNHFHFFGSIVSVVCPKGANMDYFLIDGQQRVTTVSLLLLAIHDLIETENPKTAQDAQLSDLIYQTYLYNKYFPKGPKLQPVEKDRTAYENLFQGNPNFSADSRIVANYKYFYNQLQKDADDKKYTYDDLFQAICRLQIISITLDSSDDPQLIFESLNSTGLALSEGDKIRNFILMGQPAKTQDLFYTQYWKPIELYAGGKEHDVSAFVRDYLSVKRQRLPGMGKVYFEFKSYIEEAHSKDMEPVLKDMLDYSRRYKILLDGEIKKTGKEAQKQAACIFRLNHLETTITRPFFLEILRLNEENTLTDSEVTEIFTTTESYIFRRSVCNIPTNALNKIFLTLNKEILGYDGTADNYVEKFKYALLSKQESGRFPRNDEFATAFTGRDVYTTMSSKNRIYLLERLENRNQFINKNVYDLFSNNIYSIEHVMPQALTSVWRNDLGVDYERVHKMWLHKIANLTMTAYNADISNLSFLEKKIMPKGFCNDSLYLNQWIAQQDKWTEEVLIKRNDLLKSDALKIWPLPETKFKPKQKVLPTYNLSDDDDDSLTGKKLAGFIYKDVKQPAKSWRKMFETMLKMLYAENKSELSFLAAAQSDENELSRYFSTDETTFPSYFKVDDGIFVKIHLNTMLMVSILRKLLKTYAVDSSELTFILSDKS